MVARYGGEEFVVLLADCPTDLAEARLGKVLESIATTRFEYEENGQVRALRFSASCGLTEFTEGESPAGLLRRADSALYDAKKKGKNRVATRKRSIFENLFGRHVS
jgi:diguanylate cyclase (GGDEF)-like protein